MYRYVTADRFVCMLFFGYMLREQPIMMCSTLLFVVRRIVYLSSLASQLYCIRMMHVSKLSTRVAVVRKLLIWPMMFVHPMVCIVCAMQSHVYLIAPVFRLCILIH